MRCEKINITDLIGQTMVEVKKGVAKSSYEKGTPAIIFNTAEGEIYEMYHSQDCCECVNIEDICGDLQDLVGSPILVATEDKNDDDDPPDDSSVDESFTWTFYTFRTNKGTVTIRWFGTSNGYYSEDANVYRVIPKPDDE